MKDQHVLADEPSGTGNSSLSFAIVDLETTGGSPRTARVIELAIIIHNGHNVVEEFSTLLNPQAPIPPFIQGMTGISDDMVQDAPSFEDIYVKILELTEGRIFVAHNVRFDYAVLRSEYKRLGLRFQRKQLCTVRLSRKLYPSLPSHSLGNLCRDLDIPVVNRHRAYGDAHATALLLEHMLMNKRKELLRHMVKDEVEETILPPSITRKQLNALPEEVGIYYFLDERGNILYIGKSKNIQKRVINHFSNDLKKKRFAQMKEQVYDISYELTGNELLASLRESAEIKRWMPHYNKAQRKKKYVFGVYAEQDQEGVLLLKMRRIHGQGFPIRQFATRNSAVQYLQRIVEKYGLRPDYCDLPREKWPDLAIIPSEGEHHEGVRALQKSFMFPHKTFVVITDGRDFEEQAVVLVEDGKMMGYGFIPQEFAPHSLEELRDRLNVLPDDQETREILMKWLHKNAPKLLPFDENAS